MYLSCAQYDRAVTLLNNMRHVDLAALLLEACLEAGVLLAVPSSPEDSSNQEQPTASPHGDVPACLTPTHRAVYYSFARHLDSLGHHAAAQWYWTHRAGEMPK